MSRVVLITAASVLGIVASSSIASADGPPRAFIGGAPFTWNGMYIGYQSGVAWGETRVSDPFGPSIFGDNIRTPGGFAGGVIGYNWQMGAAVLGVEADANWADLEGTNTCFAFSGFFISSNCRSHVDALGTLTARLGLAVGPEGRTLLYVKGGGAWEDTSVDATAGTAFGGVITPTTSVSGVKWGWTVGAGVEHALRGGWSVKAEYDYLAFGNSNLTSPITFLQTAPPNPGSYALVPGVGASTSQDIHEFKLGLNYRFGAGDPYGDDGWLGRALKDGFGPTAIPGTEFEIGARYVYGWGRFQKDLGIQGLPLTNLASRLTYDGMNTNGGEIFARLDTRQNIMVKGLIGAGSGSNGHMNDEDWLPFGLFVPYSNTVSSVDDRITYGTIDAGYDWMRGPGYKLASFVGYNVMTQNMKALGCTQIANPFSDCFPPIPTSVLGITEKDTWQSVRIGSASDFFVLPRVKVSVDAAYLPYVWFEGTDNHVLRSLVSPEDGHGQGVQLDLMVSYALTDQFSLGVGGRYWAMWTTSGETNFGGSGFMVPQRFAVEQAAVLVQGSYKFGDSCCAAPLK
jgi:opacity protein-like surface antigen